jgi:hypothetical protein
MSDAMMEHLLGRPPHKVFFGQNAEKAYARLFMQDGGQASEGVTMMQVAGVVGFDPGVIPLREDGEYRDAEMWICEVIIRPIERYRDTEGACKGMGLSAAVTGDGLSKPTYATRVL